MISPDDFCAWQKTVLVEERPIRGAELARRLGRHEATISHYRINGVPDTDEKMMRLAMAAISADVKPWQAP